MTAPGVVGIVEETGGISYVREADLATAKAEGARVATQDEIDRSNYRGGLAGAAATADALQRGATFGLGDKLQVEGARLLGGDEAASQMAQKGRLLRDEFADTNDVAEIAGGFLLPVPGGGLAKGIGGAVAKGVAGVAERAGLRGLAGVAEHVLPGAIAAGYEGAVMGAGSVVSEAALGDHDINAEKLMAGAGKGALFGSVLGGGIGLMSGAVGSRMTKAVEEAGLKAEQATTRAEAAATRIEGAAVRAEEAAVRPMAAEGGGLLGKIQGMADEESYRALGGLTKQRQLLGSTAERQAERAQGIGKLLRDEGIVTATATKGDMAERLSAKLNETGRELGAMRKALDETGVKVSTAPIMERVQAEVLAPLEAKLGFKNEAAQIRGYLTELGEKAGPETSFQKLHELRKNIEEKAGFDKVSSPAFANELKRVRAIVEDEFTKAGEVASAAKGEGFAEKYAASKAKYSMLADAEKASKRGLEREGVNRTWSITDAIMAGPAVAALGPVGLLAAGANKMLRTYGNQTAAVALNHIAGIEGVQRAAAHFDSLLGRDVGAVVGKKSGAISRVSQPRAEAIAKGLLENPEALQARVASFVGTGLRDVAPKTAAAVGDVATRALTFLATRAPKDRSVVNGAQPRTESREPSRQETMRFSRYVEAIDDPLIVVKGLRNGNVTREHVEAVREVYPRLYAVMQGRLAEEVAKLPKALPYPTRVALSVLFDTPLDASMRPDIIAGIQSQYMQPKSQRMPPSRPLNVSSITHAPASARIEGPSGR